MFDIIYFLFMIIIIAVMSSATGSVVEETTGLNYWVGVTAITVIVGLLNFYGEHLIEHFETLGTILLYIGYIMFSVLVISTHYDNIGTVFANNDSSFVAGATAFDSIWNGIIYMAFNLVVLPASFFTIKRQTSRKQSIISGIIGGILMTIPWFLTYFSVMGFYPSDKVLSAPVPWVVMMQSCNAGSFMYIFFGIVMGWTLIETATGIIHAMLTRIDKSLEERHGGQLSRTQKGGLTIGILIASMGMAQIGIIDLIAKGYNALAYAFIAIFLIPLFTVGVYKIHQKRKEELAALAVVNSEENPSPIECFVYYTVDKEDNGSIDMGNILYKADIVSYDKTELYNEERASLTLSYLEGGRLFYTRSDLHGNGSSSDFNIYSNSLDGKNFKASELKHFDEEATNYIPLGVYEGNNLGVAKISDSGKIIVENLDKSAGSVLVDPGENNEVSKIICSRNGFLYYVLDSAVYKISLTETDATAEKISGTLTVKTDYFDIDEDFFYFFAENSSKTNKISCYRVDLDSSDKVPEKMA